MWERLEPADIHRAKESLGHRLAETLKRHDEETSRLRAKHAEEVHVLEGKQVDIDALVTLIDRFAGEFQTGAVSDPTADQQQWSAEVAGERGEEDTEKATERETTEVTQTSLPEKLSIRYGSPNFLRKFGS